MKGSRHALLGAALLLAACAQTRHQAPEPVDEALGLLPDPTGLHDLKPTGEPQRAAGQQLFELIDGGAELFLTHGFAEAIAQEYESSDGVRFSVEIFLMKDAAGAGRIYAARGGTTTDGPSIGDASSFEDYYGHYLVGRLYFTVTASRTSGDLRPPIERLARAVVERLQPAE